MGARSASAAVAARNGMASPPPAPTPDKWKMTMLKGSHRIELRLNGEFEGVFDNLEAVKSYQKEKRAEKEHAQRMARRRPGYTHDGKIAIRMGRP